MNRSKGTCASNFRIPVEDIERRILVGLRGMLDQPDIAEAYLRQCDAAFAELNKDRHTERSAIIREINLAQSRISKIVTAIENGADTPAMLSRLKELEHQKAQAEQKLPMLQTTTVQTWSTDQMMAMLNVFADHIVDTLYAMGDIHRVSEIIRTFIYSITIHPCEDGINYDPVLEGPFVNLPGVKDALLEGKTPEPLGSGVIPSMVAGIGFEPMTFRL